MNTLNDNEIWKEMNKIIYLDINLKKEYIHGYKLYHNENNNLKDNKKYYIDDYLNKLNKVENDSVKIKNIIKKNNINHIYILPHGNSQWAIKNNLEKETGYFSGFITNERIFDTCIDYNIKYLTILIMSNEKFSDKNINVTNSLLITIKNFLEFKFNSYHEKNIRLKFIGDLSGLNLNIRDIFLNYEKITESNDGLFLQMIINYSSRQEILNAIINISKDAINNNLLIENINEKLVSNYLYTKNIPEADLIIKTGRNYKLENLMFWQTVSSKIYFDKSYWPEFDKNKFNDIIIKLFKNI